MQSRKAGDKIGRGEIMRGVIYHKKNFKLIPMSGIHTVLTWEQYQIILNQCEKIFPVSIIFQSF